MNCTVCSKLIDSHVEGRETDLCVNIAEDFVFVNHEGLYSFDQTFTTVWTKEAILELDKSFFFNYSSRKMTPETWGLTDKWRNFYLIKVNPEPIEKWELRESVFRHGDGYPVYYAPTAPLAICRAFLAKEEEE